jgi:hypothetical protein
MLKNTEDPGNGKVPHGRNLLKDGEPVSNLQACMSGVQELMAQSNVIKRDAQFARNGEQVLALLVKAQSLNMRCLAMLLDEMVEMKGGKRSIQVRRLPQDAVLAPTKAG